MEKKYIGLIKWFDTQKGFGVIENSLWGEVFLHFSNLKCEREEILAGKPTVFEKVNRNGRQSALNVYLPNTYEDFKLILQTSNLDDKTFLNALKEIFKSINTSQIFVFFSNYFIKEVKKDDLNEIQYFLRLTERCIYAFELKYDGLLLEKIKIEIKKEKEQYGIFDFNYKNRFLIKELFYYYLQNIDNDLLFPIWKKRLHFVYSDIIHPMFNDSSSDIVNFIFPSEIFLQNYSAIDYPDLKLILRQVNGADIAGKIIRNQIYNLQCNSLANIIQTFNKISLINCEASENELHEVLKPKILLFFSNQELHEIDIQYRAGLERVIKFLNDTLFYHEDSVFIKEINKFFNDDTKFYLWQKTKYFEPDPSLLNKFISAFTYKDFIESPTSFHIEYFEKNLREISNLKSEEQYGLTTFIVVETPLNIINEIFSKLTPAYKIAYWLNFPRNDSLNDNLEESSSYYEFQYDVLDIPFNSDDIIDYIGRIESLNETIIANEVIKGIQNVYDKNKANVFKFDLDQRICIIQKLSSADITDEIKIQFFKEALNKIDLTRKVDFIRSFIPKFIDKQIVLEKLIDLFELQEDRKDMLNYLHKIASEHEKIFLWLNGYSSQVEYEHLFNLFTDFSEKDQSSLFKKLFLEVQQKKITIDYYWEQIRKFDTNLNLRTPDLA